MPTGVDVLTLYYFFLCIGTDTGNSPTVASKSFVLGQRLMRPQPDPLTDSDFYSSCCSEGEPESIVMISHRHQNVNSTPPSRILTIQSEMDSSGMVSDFCPEESTDGNLTVIHRSSTDSKIPSGALPAVVNKEKAVKFRREIKRDPSSKLKYPEKKSTQETNIKTKKGRWEEVMSSIKKNQEEVKSRPRREVLSRLMEGVAGASRPPSNASNRSVASTTNSVKDTTSMR